MGILFITNELCFDHLPGNKHPEQPDRLSAVLASFQRAEFKLSLIHI